MGSVNWESPGAGTGPGKGRGVRDEGEWKTLGEEAGEEVEWET
jgi:hypothetical protein